MNLQEMITEARSKVKELTLADFKEKDSSLHTLIDVREPAEFQQGHLQDAINIPRGVIEMKLSMLPEFKNQNKEIILMCQTGGRSALAAVSLKKLGFNKILSLQGGFDECVKQNFQISD